MVASLALVNTGARPATKTRGHPVHETSGFGHAGDTCVTIPRRVSVSTTPKPDPPSTLDRTARTRWEAELDLHQSVSPFPHVCVQEPPMCSNDPPPDPAAACHHSQPTQKHQQGGLPSVAHLETSRGWLDLLLHTQKPPGVGWTGQRTRIGWHRGARLCDGQAAWSVPASQPAGASDITAQQP